MIPIELACAKTEDEVTKIINSSSFFLNGKWKPLGGFENNYGVVLNQQAHPVASIVEKIINSSDALLIKECRKRGIDPEGSEAPISMFDAVEEFFNIKEGNLNNLNSKERKELAKNIRVIADGEKPEPNIIVADLGEGQHPEDFEGTFLTILKGTSRKRYIPFVQGMFYMGGSGVLPNCGKNGYELIISKKAPELQESVKSKDWGWTIVRKNADLQRYEYFVDEKELIPTINVNNLDILPHKESLPYGTFIKMYNYKMDTKSNITADLWKKLNIFLSRSPLPVLLQETRDFESAVMEIILDGNLYAIYKNRDKLQTEFVIEEKLGELGSRKIKICVFKDDLKPKENFYTTENEAIFFTINGQTHGTFGRSFIKTRASKPRLSRSLLVSIDCTDIVGTLQHDTFMPSRDRMRINEITTQITEDLAGILRNDETLKQIDNERYQKLIEKSVDDSEFANKIVGRLIETNRDLIKYLKLGGKLTHPSKPGEKKATPKFEDFPTLLNIKGWKDSKGLYVKEIPINSTNSKIDFELDAPDDYFDRDWAPGELIFRPQECFGGRKQKDGILRIKLFPMKDTKICDEHLVEVEVTRYANSSLFAKFMIKYTKPTPLVESKPATRKEKLPELQELGLPEPKLVHRDGWNEHGWTGEDVVKIEARENGNTPLSDLKIFINMDNDDLIAFKRRGDFISKAVNAVDKSYEIGVLLYSLTSYIELLNKKSELKSNEFEPVDIVPIVMKGISKALLDMIWNPGIRELLQEA